ncbi:transcriptional regulator, partial [Klebsiella pneumoniae]
EHNNHPAVFALSDIHLVQPLTESFRRNERLYRLTEDLRFIRALPHFSVVLQSLNSLSSL